MSISESLVRPTHQWDTFSLWVIDLFAPMVEKFGLLSILGEYTYFKPLGAADPFLTPYAQSAGFELSVFKFLIALFLAYPFSALLYHLPPPSLKHLCSFVVGLVFVQWIFAADWIHTFISSIGTYLICALFPKRYIGVAGFVWVMGYLIVCHIYTMQIRYLSEEFDFLRTQMVITMKLTSFAYNLYDGTYDAARVFGSSSSSSEGSSSSSSSGSEKERRERKILAARKQFAIRALPSLLEFLGYVYCFPCILVGPAFEYQDYLRPITGEAFLFTTSTSPSTLGEKKKKIIKRPSTFLPAMRRLVLGLFFMVLYLITLPHCDIAHHYQLPFIHRYHMIHRLILLYLALLVQRFKFFFAWKVAEGGSILGGFGFEGYDEVTGEERGWKGAENVDILGVETSSSIQQMTRHWNKRTQGWLERYTYLRTERSLIAIYAVSAIWHGLYPGYFFAFLTVPLPTNIERLIKQKITPRVVPEFDGYDYERTYPRHTVRGRVYEIICWLGTWSAMCYSMQVFYMLSVERTMNCWREGYGFIGHLIMIAIYLLLSFIPDPHPSSKAGGGRAAEPNKNNKKKD